MQQHFCSSVHILVNNVDSSQEAAPKDPELQRGASSVDLQDTIHVRYHDVALTLDTEIDVIESATTVRLSSKPLRSVRQKTRLVAGSLIGRLQRAPLKP